jgi:hypothetical protein
MMAKMMSVAIAPIYQHLDDCETRRSKMNSAAMPPKVDEPEALRKRLRDVTTMMARQGQRLSNEDHLLHEGSSSSGTDGCYISWPDRSGLGHTNG